MNDSTNHNTDSPEPDVSEGTRALEDLAAEVEQERVRRGRSSLDPIVLPDGEALAEEIAHPDGVDDDGDDQHDASDERTHDTGDVSERDVVYPVPNPMHSLH